MLCCMRMSASCGRNLQGGTYVPLHRNLWGENGGILKQTILIQLIPHYLLLILVGCWISVFISCVVSCVLCDKRMWPSPAIHGKILTAPRQDLCHWPKVWSDGATPRNHVIIHAGNMKLFFEFHHPFQCTGRYTPVFHLFDQLQAGRTDQIIQGLAYEMFCVAGIFL